MRNVAAVVGLSLSLLVGSHAFAGPDAVVIPTGDLRIKGVGSGIVFPDGSIQYKAAGPLTLATICAAIEAGGVAKPEFCGGGTGVNSPPVAASGADRASNVGNTVSLSGAGSSDPDGDALTYVWTITSKPAGSNAVLTGATSQNTSFIPDVAGTYVLSLVVNDGRVSSIPDTVTITVSVVQQPTDYVITATGLNDASFSRGSSGPDEWDGSRTTTVGSVTNYPYWNPISNTISEGVTYNGGLIEFDLGQIGDGVTVTKATLHAYVFKVLRVNNLDTYVASLNHLRSTGYTGAAEADYKHIDGPVPQIDQVYKYRYDTQPGWMTIDVTALVQGDVSAGIKWSVYWLTHTAWESIESNDQSKGVSLYSANYSTGMYAPYLEVTVRR